MAPVPYTTPEKVRNLVARSSGSRPGTGASIADDQINEAISTASQRIDSNLGLVFAIPFQTPPPPLIIDIATAIAAYEVDLTFRETRDYNSTLNPVLLRYTDMMKELEKLRKGETILPGYEAPPDSEIPDNPNDGGSIVDVVNQPELTYPCPPSYWDYYYGRAL